MMFEFPSLTPEESVFEGGLLDFQPFEQEAQFEEPIVIYEGQELERFTYRFDLMLERSKQAMTGIHERARKYQKVYKLLRKEELPFEDAPNLTLPTSRNKADGVLAHILDAIEQRPLMSFNYENAQAAQEAPILEALLESEINFSKSREKLTSGTAKPAVITGTAILWYSLTQMPGGEVYVKPNVVDLENFFIDRINVDDASRAFVARFRRKPFYDLEEDAENGIITQESLEKIREHIATREFETLEEEQYNFDENFWREENRLIGFYEGYIRYKPKDAPKSAPSSYHHVLFHKPTRTIMALRESPFGKHQAFNAPPVVNVRIFSTNNRFFGVGIMEILDSIQELADDGANAHLMLQRFATNPVTLYNENSPFAAALEEGLIPGKFIPQQGPIERPDVHTITFPNDGAAIQDVAFADQQADRATYNDETVAGSGGGSRQTAYEYSARLSIGALRLRLNLRDYNYDMSRAAEMYWAVLNVFKIKPNGIMRTHVGEGAKLVSYQGMSREQVFNMVANMVAPMVSSVEEFVMSVWQVLEELSPMLTDGAIPSTRRRDMHLSLTGTKVIADKIAEAQMYEQFGQHMQLIPVADQDRRIWYMLKRIAETKDIKDWPRLLGPEPTETVDMETFMRLIQPYIETMQHSVTQ